MEVWIGAGRISLVEGRAVKASGARIGAVLEGAAEKRILPAKFQTC
jgi:hypothetical protein